MIDPRKPNYASTPVAPDRAAFAYALAPDARELGAVGVDADGIVRHPVVTVVTPYFNTGEVFRETARCVLGQSLQNFEWVIVNDGSSDPAALAVLDEFRELSRRDPRIRIIDHRVNSGLSAARNTGFRVARAPYVFMLDSDDLIEHTTIEKCALFLECNAAFAFVKGYTVGFGGQEYLWEKGFHDGAAMLRENLVTATTMVRRSVHAAVGGFDETIRGGMEDWEFWIRAASLGHWGATIPEYLDWYRRRPGPAPSESWANLACSERQRLFRRRVSKQHPRLFKGGFPKVERAWHNPHADVPERITWSNPLARPTSPRRLLMIVPWLRLGGADKFNIDLIRGLTDPASPVGGSGGGGPWEITVATTLNGHPWLPEFSRLTPDVFLLENLASLPDQPRLLRHLIESRRPDVVLISNSELGYFALPFLRAHCPEPVYIDVNHMEEPYWKNGGHPRQGAGMQEQLDLGITVSGHLRRWMVARGADFDRTQYCHLNVDTQQWRPDETLRRLKREELGIKGDVPVILYPVRLTAQKQPMVFGDAIRRTAELLGQAGGDTEFVALVAGDGEMRPDLKRYIDRHGLASRVRMLGAVAIDDMPALYNAADILFLPSLHEGIALTIYEAMASGLAVVGAEVGGQAELVVEGTGYLLAPRVDKGEEAAACARVLADLILDPQKRRRIGRAAREHVEAHHTVDRMIRRMLELFDLAAHNKRTQPRTPLPPVLAREFAVTGVDWLRYRDLADDLWAFKERVLAEQTEAHRRAQREEAAAVQAVALIESSSAYRLVQRCKRLPLYRLYARGRFGPDWEAALQDRPNEGAHHRLARIRASRSYRAIATLKRLPPVQVISRLRHGKDYRDSLPELIRHD